MGLLPPGMGVNDATRAYIAVKVSIDIAMHAASARVTEPESFPTLPQGEEGLSDWLTRKTMADLLEIGFTPDGWETAYMRGVRG